MKLPAHKCSLSIEHNPNRDFYETVENYLLDNCPHFQTPEHKTKAIETNELWIMHWYPETPVGFHQIAAPTLAELLAFAGTFEHEMLEYE